MENEDKVRIIKGTRNIAIIGIIFILALVFLYAAYQLNSYAKESKESENLFNDLADKAVEFNEIPDTDLSEETSIEAEPDTEEEGEKKKEYILPTSSPIKADFNALHGINSDIKAWLYCENTVINYPVVQGADNNEYLHTLINGSYNRGGTLFIESTNQPDFSDWNTLIYGHNMKNGTMFGTLMEYNSQEYYDEHPIWYLLTPQGNYYVELISGFVTDIYDEIYSIPETMEEKEALVQSIMKKSTFATNAKLSSEDKLVTFSTCAYDYDDARYVVIGILKEL